MEHDNKRELAYVEAKEQLKIWAHMQGEPYAEVSYGKEHAVIVGDKYIIVKVHLKEDEESDNRKNRMKLLSGKEELITYESDKTVNGCEQVYICVWIEKTENCCFFLVNPIEAYIRAGSHPSMQIILSEDLDIVYRKKGLYALRIEKQVHSLTGKEKAEQLTNGLKVKKQAVDLLSLIIEHIKQDVFYLQELYDVVSADFKALYPTNHHIESAIRHCLQLLRNEGLLEFDEKQKGKYKKCWI